MWITLMQFLPLRNVLTYQLQIIRIAYELTRHQMAWSLSTTAGIFMPKQFKSQIADT